MAEITPLRFKKDASWEGENELEEYYTDADKRADLLKFLGTPDGNGGYTFDRAKWESQQEEYKKLSTGYGDARKSYDDWVKEQDKKGLELKDYENNPEFQQLDNAQKEAQAKLDKIFSGDMQALLMTDAPEVALNFLQVYGEVEKNLKDHPELKEKSIEAFPYYSPLRSQIKAIKSFDRPVILVDDLLHHGGRFEALEPMLREEGVEIKKLVLGMISGYGRDTMATKGVPVDSIYYIPNLRNWFVESTLYPFIGGDTVRRDTVKVAGLTPSINMILPYAAPPVQGSTPEAAFEFSACCIRNARNILLVLESEYRALFARNLTLSRLSEAVILPLCPDKGECVSYDPNLAASVYLENDLEMLYRTRK